MLNFIPAKIESDTPQQYSVEYIFGKKCHHSSDAPLYAVKWEGYDKSEMTWEPQSSFSTEASILRFERCCSYKFYHSKIHQRKANNNVRVHILRQYYQVHSIITESVKQKKQQQLLIDSDSGDLFINENLKNEDDDVVDVDNYDKDIVFIRRGRGRPRKVDKEREMQALRNEFQVFRMDRPASQMELLQRAQMESQVNPFQPQSSYQNQMFFQHQNVLQRLKIKVERDYLNEIIQNSKQKEQTQQNIKRNPNDEILENEATKKKNRETGILKNTGVQYETQEEKPLPTFYDMFFEPKQLNQKLLFELILSHHLINNKLVFKCQTEQEQIYYAEYNVLQDFCPTLLLDYMAIYSILI